MKRIYVIGNPVKQSLSPVMHNAALKHLGLDKMYSYEALHLRSEELQSFVNKMRNRKFHAASVTIPFKEEILQYADIISKEAELIQAANTIYSKNGMIYAHNTDGQGCIQSLFDSDVILKGKKVLIIGSGGAAKAIAISLLLENIKSLFIINRTISRAESLSHEINNNLHKTVITGSFQDLSQFISEVDILIHATSVGMKGTSEGISLIPSSYLHKYLIVLDIVYNPMNTALLIDAEKNGAKTINGLGMLIYQGAEQFELFTNKKAPVEIMKKSILEVLE